MSNPEQDAAANVRKLLSGLKGLMALEPGLESLGSIKQAENEARSRLTKLQDDERQFMARISAAKDQVETATVAAEQIAAAAAAAAARIATAAQAEADRIATNAKTDAENTVAAARGRAADLDATLTAKRNVLGDLIRDISAAQTRLDTINAQLAELRKKF